MSHPAFHLWPQRPRSFLGLRHFSTYSPRLRLSLQTPCGVFPAQLHFYIEQLLLPSTSKSLCPPHPTALQLQRNSPSPSQHTSNSPKCCHFYLDPASQAGGLYTATRPHQIILSLKLPVQEPGGGHLLTCRFSCPFAELDDAPRCSLARSRLHPRHPGIVHKIWSKS